MRPIAETVCRIRCTPWRTGLASTVRGLSQSSEPFNQDGVAHENRIARPDFSHVGHGATVAWVERFTVRVGQRLAVVEADDVDWIEADGDDAALHAGQQVYLLRETLYQLSLRLDPRKFLRIHRSAIVRIDRVAELEALPNRDYLLRLRDGTPLRASRTYVDKLQAALK
ncbi:LytTR family transcriptional regulator [Dyella monticola]|uniref:LytTR family transcriptional regulator n=1 Tax=Dyella monticola TaxID=1927958 RepID=A0A370X503_9GAMM|nr:LytTR family transcriptional regulator [Dyella monticola]